MAEFGSSANSVAAVIDTDAGNGAQQAGTARQCRVGFDRSGDGLVDAFDLGRQNSTMTLDRGGQHRLVGQVTLLH